MFQRLLFLLVFVSLVTLRVDVLYAQDTPKPKAPSFSLTGSIPVHPDVKIGTLENGITYYILVNKKPEKRMELRLAVNAGSVLEDDDQQGLAHFLEHMAFNGSKNFKKNELVQYLESIGTRFGADLNAYTSFDETVYMLQIPTDKPELIDKGFLVLEDWAANMSLDHAEIDKERGVIVEEKRTRSGAGQRIAEKQYPFLFNKAKYADRLPIGKEEILRTFPYEVIKRFYKKWYRPDNMAVVAVGDFDVATVEAKIREHFSRIEKPAEPLLRPIIPVPDHAETLFAIVTDPEATGTSVTLTTKIPVAEMKKIIDYRRAMAEELYESMLNDRLQELTQQGNPPFTSAYAGFGGLTRSKDAYRLGAQVESHGIIRGLQAVATEAERVRRHGFTVTELERAKTNILRQMERSYNERDKIESGSIVMNFVRHFLDGDPIPGVELDYQLYKKYLPTLTVAEVNAVTQRIPAEGNLVVTVSMPEKAGLKPPTKEELAAVMAEVKNSKLEPYVDKVSDKPLAVIPESKVKVTATKQIKELGLTEWTLSNGIRVLLKPTDFKNDEIRFAAVSPGGNSLVAKEDYLSASLAATIVSSCGLGEFTPTDLQKTLTGKVATVRPFISDLSEGFSGSAAPKDVETMFQLLYLSFTQPRKDTAMFSSFLSRMNAMLENMGARPESVLSDTMTVTMAQYHPLRKPLNIKRLAEVNLDAAMRAYLNRFADAGDFTFVFVGNFALDSFKPLVEKYLGALPVTGRKETWRDLGVRSPEGRIEKVVKKGIENKAMVMLVFTGPFEWNRQNRYDLSSLGELMQIKLREAVREEKGGTYGVGVGATAVRYPLSEYRITINFGCDPARVDELVTTTVDELSKILKNGAGEEDLKKIKEIQVREREKNLKENNFWLTRLQAAITNNDDPTDLLAFDAMVGALTSDALKKMADTVLRFDSMKKFVLMPEDNATK